MKQDMDFSEIQFDPKTEANLQLISGSEAGRSKMEKIRYLINHYKEWQDRIVHLEARERHLTNVLHEVQQILHS